MIYKKVKKVDEDNYKIVEVEETSEGFKVTNTAVKKSWIKNDIKYLEKELARKKKLLLELK